MLVPYWWGRPQPHQGSNDDPHEPLNALLGASRLQHDIRSIFLNEDISEELSHRIMRKSFNASPATVSVIAEPVDPAATTYDGMCSWWPGVSNRTWPTSFMYLNCELYWRGSTHVCEKGCVDPGNRKKLEAPWLLIFVQREYWRTKKSFVADECRQKLFMERYMAAERWKLKYAVRERRTNIWLDRVC